MRFLIALASIAFAVSLHAAPPNIVMIVSDDHHWGDYGFMGHSHIQTPHLDKLASQSRIFTRGYVPSSLCCPSLATMITGLFPHQHKVTSNDPPPAKGEPLQAGKRQGAPSFKQGREVMNKFLEAVPTLPRALGEKGYLSLQTGKWWQGHYSRGGFTHGMTEGQRHGDKGLDIGRKTMQPIFDFIAEARSKEKPFFVWYAPMMPHDPHTPPERLLAKYKDKAPSEHVAKYWAMVEWFDETCGQLVDHIDQNGLGENTIVVYVTDNGWIQNTNAPNYAPKSKQSQYDGGLRTPIMIRWTGKAAPKKDTEHLAHSIDLMPTLLKAAGIEPAKNMQGIDLLDDAAVQGRSRIFGECFTHNAVNLQVPGSSLRWRYVIEGNWKLIIPHQANQPGDVTELYDLAADPHEEKNLALADADRVEQMTQVLDGWWRP